MKRHIPVLAAVAILVLTGCSETQPQQAANPTTSDTSTASATAAAKSVEATCDDLFSGGEGSRLSKAEAFLTKLKTKITGDELMEAKSIAEDLDSVAHDANKDVEVQIQALREPFKALLSASTGTRTLETSGFTTASRKLQDLCPSSTPKQPTAIATPSHSPTPTVPAAATSIRGNLVVDVGTELEVRRNGVSLVAITVKGITPKAECNSQYLTPQRGQTVILDMEITASPALAQEQFPQFTTITGWKAVSSDGVTVNGRIDNNNCIAPAERVPAEIGPSEKIVGKMAFDLPPGAGTLIWQPSGSIKGWEWNYGP